ncbi:MAG: hypothetical protein DI536_15490 [Archangium gephyra]|uniref:Uncharacterized protein n=1 Tax=Archangium gephyra TaxID=48 RepID=A0A2W5TLX6_9BACT|nr:MAG: hypothetical protein DI536_15490 [Archangium gephyra]
MIRFFAKALDDLVTYDAPAVWAIHAIDEFEVRTTPGMKVRSRRPRDEIADCFLNGRADAARTIRAMWVKSKWKAKR